MGWGGVRDGKGVELRREPSERHTAGMLSCYKFYGTFFYLFPSLLWFDTWARSSRNDDNFKSLIFSK